MNIELKKIHHSKQLSQETEAFTADIYVNGMKAGLVSNQGHGGPTGYLGYDERGRALIRQAEEWAEALPPHIYPADELMPEFTLDMNLEHYIDNLLRQHLQEKELAAFRKKMEKAMINGIVYGVPDESFGRVVFKRPLAEILAMPNGVTAIQNTILNRILPELTNDAKILNNNIPEKIMIDAGLKPDQYLKPGQLDQAKNRKPWEGGEDTGHSNGVKR